jgi:hypothetical protein
MNNGRLLAIVITLATAAFIVAGTLRPIPSAIDMVGSGTNLLRPSSSPQAAVEILADEIGRQAWERAYSSFANKSEFTELEFVRDLTGTYPSLRRYATLESFDVRPLHASPDEAQVQLKMRWSTVVGMFLDTRNLRVLRTGNHWEVVWPIVKEPRVPPQVIPVTYLRWDVIYRGPEDDWGSQDVEAPHVRIVDMHPVDRSGGVVIMGELLNEDVVPAFVTVKATLLAKNGSAIATEDTFDKMAHILLPKQVTPFLIAFQNVEVSEVDNIHMEPTASLVAASADPVIGIEDQHLNPVPGASLSGKLVNHSGQVVNVAHVLGTFYDKDGQLVWVADQYVDRALLPQTPVSFAMSLPADIAGSVNAQRVIATTFSSGRFQ